MQVTIGFSSPNKFKLGAQLIKFWQRINYSHVFISFHSKKLNNPMVLHSAHGNVHLIMQSNFLKDNNIIKEYTFDIPIQEDDLFNLILPIMGSPYGYSELFKIIAFDTMNTFGIKIITYNGRGYICSELVGKILSITFSAKFMKPIYLLTPKDIDLWLGSNLKKQ